MNSLRSHILSANTNVRMREKPVLKFLDVQSTDKVLDVGCGLGYFLWKLKKTGAQLHGIDTSPESVAYVHNHITPHTVVAGCEKIPYPDNTFDKALFCEVIEHVADTASAIREIRRVLKPGGRLIVTTPALEGWLATSKLKKLGHHHGGEKHERDGYRRKELETLLEQNGFHIIKSSLHMFLFSELMMELTKVVYLTKKKTFEAQSDLLSVQKSLSFRILNALLTIFIPLFRLEDLILVPLFKKGHALIVCAEKS